MPGWLHVPRNALFAALAVLSLSLAVAPTLWANAEDPPLPPAFVAQQKANLRPDGSAKPFAIVLVGGVGNRWPEMEGVRRQYVGHLARAYPDAAADVAIYAIPSFGGPETKNSGGTATSLRDSLSVLGRQSAGLRERDLPLSAPQAIAALRGSGHYVLALYAHSGGGQPVNYQMPGILKAVEGQQLDGRSYGFRVGTLNSDLWRENSNALQARGYVSREFQSDWASWFQRRGRDNVPAPIQKLLSAPGSLIPGGDLPGKTLVNVAGNSLKALKLPVALASVFTQEHRFYEEQAVRSLVEGLGIDRAVAERRERREAAMDAALREAAMDAALRPQLPVEPSQPRTGPPSASSPPPPDPPGGGGAVGPGSAGAPGGPPGAAGAPGGIDFTSVELRYLVDGTTEDGRVFGAALRATTAPPGQGLTSDEDPVLAWMAFFVSLALPDEAFWVNLNPGEPTRITDAKLGQTDVARIMLEADLQLKRDTAALTHPQTSGGRAFWDGLGKCAAAQPGGRGQEASELALNHRTWIVPGEVAVWADEQQVYVLAARLDVKLESEYARVVGRAQTSQTTEFQRCAESLLRSLVLPELVKAANEAPQYRKLRQVFVSRVVAEWYKTRPDRSELLYGPLAGLGDVAPFRSEVSWSPQGIFEQYRRSFTEGEYNVTERQERREGNTIVTTTRRYFTGGIDWTRVPLVRLSPEQVLQRDPEVLDRLLGALIVGEHHSAGQVWIGGVFPIPGSSGRSGNTGSRDQQGGAGSGAATPGPAQPAREPAAPAVGAQTPATRPAPAPELAGSRQALALWVGILLILVAGVGALLLAWRRGRAAVGRRW